MLWLWLLLLLLLLLLTLWILIKFQGHLSLKTPPVFSWPVPPVRCASVQRQHRSVGSPKLEGPGVARSEGGDLHKGAMEKKHPQTMHFCKGNPSKWLQICIFSSLQNGYIVLYSCNNSLLIYVGVVPHFPGFQDSDKNHYNHHWFIPAIPFDLQRSWRDNTTYMGVSLNGGTPKTPRSDHA